VIRIGSLFSGIGGLELGIEAALSEHGIKHHVAWQVERDPFPRSILAMHWPSADRTVEYVTLASGSNLAPVDLICGGFPCQDLSYAGKGAGLEGERSGLWSEYRRIVCELRPQIVIMENVAALLTRGVERVLGDLAALGYDARWRCVRASDVGAPHRRERLFIVAYAHGIRRDGRARASDECAGVGELADGGNVADPHVERLEGRGGPERSGAKQRAARARRPARPDDAQLANSAIVFGIGSDHHAGSDKKSGRSLPESGNGNGTGGPKCKGVSSLRRMGRVPDGFPAWMDAPVIPDRWPSGPGEAQAGWEPPRTTAKEQDKAKRLKALGNAVVPAVGREVMRWALTWVDMGGEP